MPSVKYLKTQATRLSAAHKQMQAITELIKGKPETQEEIADMLDIAPATLRKKLNNPALFTLGDMAVLCIKYDMQGSFGVQDGPKQININW